MRPRPCADSVRSVIPKSVHRNAERFAASHAEDFEAIEQGFG